MCYALTQNPSTSLQPINPNFSFNAAEGQVFGSTAPGAVTYMSYNYDEYEPFNSYAIAGYFGNYGEARNVDVLLCTPEVTYNGEPINLKRYDTLRDWEAVWTNDGHVPGKMEYTFSNYNCVVDGIEGSNICKITFTEGTKDIVPPTVQRVMMRKTDQTVTNRFDKADDAIITITGGDFNAEVEPVDMDQNYATASFFSYAPANITVEYAPYGNQEFSQIQVEENRAREFLPGYGAFWEGSLRNVTRLSANGWYDLRITLTDEAGNTQQQVISPAFFIKSNISAIDDIREEAQNVFNIKDGSVFTADGQAATIYTFDGTRVSNKSLTSGYYIAVGNGYAAKIHISAGK